MYTVLLKSKLPPLVSFLARRDSRHGDESLTSRDESLVSRDESPVSWEPLKYTFWNKLQAVSLREND